MEHKLIVTSTDRDRLVRLMEDHRQEAGDPTTASIQKLDGELRKATIVAPQELPQEVVSMNTKALVRLNGKEKEISLVYPDDANWGNGKLSVFSPIGTALLGYREGDRIEWSVPSGSMEIEIQKVLYQPEAAGDYHL